MTFEWAETTTSLKFRIGELTLFSVRLPCVALTAHFTKLGCDPIHPRPPFERFSSGIEVALMRSHPIDKELPPLARLPEAIRYAPSQYMHCYTSLEGSFEDYLKGFSAKSRSTLLRKVRRFAEASGGSTDWREFILASDIQEFHRLAREVSSKTYQERLLDAGLPDDPAFLRNICGMAAARKARGYILFLARKPVAYIFCPVIDGALLYQYVGYDPIYRHLSPGTVLQYLVLERLMSQGGCRMFDFTEGQSQHKEFFATHRVLCADIYYFRPNLRNWLLLRLHASLEWFSQRTGALLERYGLKDRIKKFIRSKA